jgi:NhaP-type Na+/H+ or K+/H+ antiporter
VLLLGAGVVLGPDMGDVIRPNLLGSSLQTLTGFAVAVILFEGGLNLDLRRMRGQVATIQRLLTVGVVITLGGAAVAAHLFMGWGWVPSILFGSLVIVTGPTVITPLLRRIRVNRNVETILESEGVLIDALGAVIAVVVLEISLEPSGTSIAQGAVDAPTRLFGGLLIGVAGGLLMVFLLRRKHVVPDGFQNIFVLASVLLLYQFSNTLIAESGIMAAVMAGGVLGNIQSSIGRELKEFKEQLTLLMIGMLFVLLAADVRLESLKLLGSGGVLVVASLVFLVRPLNVLVCTWGTGLNWREKTFLSWVAPRGIVAAAVASLFAQRLGQAGEDNGTQLRALVFLVIAATVFLQGATAELMARLLRVRRPVNRGFAIFGAQPLGRLLARLLGEHGHEVILIDNNADLCKHAQDEGLKVVYGNAFDDHVILRSQMDTRRAAIGATHNEAINLLFAVKAREEARVPAGYVLCRRRSSGVSVAQVTEARMHLLFGTETDPELWSVRIRRGLAGVENWRLVNPEPGTELKLDGDALSLLLPLFKVGKKNDLTLIDEETRCEAGMVVAWMFVTEHSADAAAWLEQRGWSREDL